MRYSWKILLVCAVLVGGCQAEPIYRYPYHAHDDDDDDDDIDIDFDFDGDVDFRADAELDFGVDVDVDVDADIDIASKIGNAFDQITDVTNGAIVISRDPNVIRRDPNSTYTHRPTTYPTRTLRPTRTPRPTTRPPRTTEPITKPTRTPRPTRTARPTARPTRSPRPTATPTRTARPTARPTRSPRPTARPTRSPRPTARPTRSPRPTATPTRTARPTSRPTARPTRSPRPTATPTRTPRPTARPTSDRNNNGNNVSPLQIEVGELFSLTGTGTLVVEDAQGSTVQGVLLRLHDSSLRELFLTQELSEYYLIVRSSSSTRRIPLTGRASSVTWTLEQEGTKVMLNIEGGLLPDHLSAHIALRLHLVTVTGIKLASTARTASLALRDGRGSVTFTLQGNDARLNFNRGCYRWVVETLSLDRAMFGDEFGGSCR